MGYVNPQASSVERFLGCRYKSDFLDATTFARCLCTGYGSPTVANGVTYNGSNQWVRIAVTGDLLRTRNYSARFEFSPSFELDDSAGHVLYCDDSYNMVVYKTSTNLFRVLSEGKTALEVDAATLDPYWNIGGRNVFWVQCYSIGAVRDNNLYTNGVLLQNTNTYWGNPPFNAGFWLGADYNNNQLFQGTIKSFDFFREFKVTLQDVQDDWSYSLYNKHPLLRLRMTNSDHDAGNSRTLDTSGNGYHAIFGDGETGSTFPTKRTKRGYTFDSGDSLRIAQALGEQTVSIICGFSTDAYPTTSQTLVDFRRNSGTGYVSLNTSYVASSSSGTIYVNGKPGTQCGRGYNVVAVTGLSADITEGVDIGADYQYASANNLIGNIEFLEIYPGTLNQFFVADSFLKARLRRNYV